MPRMDPGPNTPHSPVDDRRFAQYLVRRAGIPLQVVTDALAEVRRQAADGAATTLEEVLARATLHDREALARHRLEASRSDESAGSSATVPALSVPPRSTVPTSFGDYYDLERIGEGGMGVVYRARSRSLGRTVALKILLSHAELDLRSIERFAQEGRAAARLSHRNIVQVCEMGQFQGKAFLAMEYVEGEDLRLWVEERRPSLAERLAIFRQLLDAVRYLHERGILHRDLKPENLRVTPEGVTKVLDFGLALALDRSTRLTSTGACVGTPAYMAPEQMDGKGGGDHRADVFSLGAILYDLLTGEQPFAGDSVAEVCHQVLAVDPEPPSARAPGLPPTLDEVVLVALAKDPARRWQSVDEMAAAFETALEPRRWARSTRRALAAVSFAALLVAVVTGVRLSPRAGDTVPETRETGDPSEVAERARRALLSGDLDGAERLAAESLSIDSGFEPAFRIQVDVTRLRAIGDGLASGKAGGAALAIAGGPDDPPPLALLVEALGDPRGRETAQELVAASPRLARWLVRALDEPGVPRSDLASILLPVLVGRLESDDPEETDRLVEAIGRLAGEVREEVLERALDVLPEGPQAAARKRLSEAVETYIDRASELHKTDTESGHRAMLPWLERGLALAPADRKVLAQLVHVLQWLREDARLLPVLDDLSRRVSSQSLTLDFYRSETHRRIGERDLAFAGFERTVAATGGRWPPALVGRAWVLYMRYDDAGALADVERALQLEPAAEPADAARRIKGLVLLRRGDTDGATAEEATQARNSVHSIHRLHLRLRLELAAGRTDDALATAQAIASADRSRDGILAAALARAAAGRWSEVKTLLDPVARAGRAMPDRDFLLQTLGRALLEAGDREAARARFEEARAENPSLPGIEDDLARAAG